MIENQYINNRIAFKKMNNYKPNLHTQKKVLTIMACHTNNDIKYKTTLNNLKFLMFHNNDIVVINSSNESHSNMLREKLTQIPIHSYIEIPNNNCLDIGKWCHVLNKINYLQYDFVVFTNDSFIIQSPINHFFNCMMKTNVELYGYNDSTQINYHYQSYLFGVKSNVVIKLITLFLKRRPFLSTYETVVENIELKLVTIFGSKDCFLRIGSLPSNKKHNIFFNNDTLYKKLLKTQLLPFIKIKRL